MVEGLSPETAPLALADEFAGGVLGLADGRPYVTFRLLGAAFGFEVAVAGRLADGLLHGSRRLLHGAGDALLIHNQAPHYVWSWLNSALASLVPRGAATRGL